MKKNKFILVFLCILTVGLLISCENFLKGAQVKSEIEAAIAYANAPSYTIMVDYPGNIGTVKSPAGGVVLRKVSDSFSLRFDSFADYEFLYWTIIDSNSQKKLSNGEYLEIESLTESETKCKLVKAPENGMQLCLTPVVAERPQILSYSPVLNDNLSFLDSTIQVVFDHDMEDESIYYTEVELKKLMSELNISDINDSNLLHTTVKGKERFYGYRKNGLVYYKNLLITNKTTGENINDCYTTPLFETKSILIIYANTSKLPPDYEQIQVSIEKDFFYYSENNKPITMAGSKKWIFQVNNQIDNILPEIFSSKITIASGNYSGKELSGNWINPEDINSSELNVLTDENKIHLSFKAKDVGSGLKPYFDIFLNQAYDENYNDFNNLTYFKSEQFNYVTLKCAI